jgi:hypothetical protein
VSFSSPPGELAAVLQGSSPRSWTSPLIRTATPEKYGPEWARADAIQGVQKKGRERMNRKASPQKILADGTGWRFLNEFQRS